MRPLTGGMKPMMAWPGGLVLGCAGEMPPSLYASQAGHPFSGGMCRGGDGVWKSFWGYCADLEPQLPFQRSDRLHAICSPFHLDHVCSWGRWGHWQFRPLAIQQHGDGLRGDLMPHRGVCSCTTAACACCACKEMCLVVVWAFHCRLLGGVAFERSPQVA